MWHTSCSNSHEWQWVLWLGLAWPASRHGPTNANECYSPQPCLACPAPSPRSHVLVSAIALLGMVCPQSFLCMCLLVLQLGPVWPPISPSSCECQVSSGVQSGSTCHHPSSLCRMTGAVISQRWVHKSPIESAPSSDSVSFWWILWGFQLAL